METLHILMKTINLVGSIDQPVKKLRERSLFSGDKSSVSEILTVSHIYESATNLFCHCRSLNHFDLAYLP